MAVSAWQLLLAALPTALRALSLVCFIHSCAHFFPLEWNLPHLEHLNVTFYSDVDTLPWIQGAHACPLLTMPFYAPCAAARHCGPCT